MADQADLLLGLLALAVGTAVGMAYRWSMWRESRAWRVGYSAFAGVVIVVIAISDRAWLLVAYVTGLALAFLIPAGRLDRSRDSVDGVRASPPRGEALDGDGDEMPPR